MNTAVVLSATGSRKPAVTATTWPGPIRALLIRVTLPDGTQQTVLVPQVYAKVKAGNLTGDGADLRWIQVMLGHRSVASTQIYIQVSIRALQAVHGSTHPAEHWGEDKTDRKENNSHNDTTSDTTKGVRDEYNPLQDR